MLQIDDVVVTMSYPGLFTVVTIDGEDVTIADADGHTYRVRAANVRRVNRNDTTSS
jgi:hypothetical protein